MKVGSPVPIESTFLNARIELLDSSYDAKRLAALRDLLALYNPTIGPIRTAGLTRPQLLDFAMYTGWNTRARLAALMPDVGLHQPGMETAMLAGSGKGAGLGQPLIGGLGEAAERLAAALHFAACAEQLIFASHRELERAGQRALGPSELPLFAPQQYARPGFAYIPFRPSTRLRWIEGYDLLTGAPVLAPAQLVLMYYKHARGEAPIGYATSGGLGLHADLRASILHSLFEYVERDAVNLRWLSRLPPARVEVDLVGFLRKHAPQVWARLATPSIEAIQVFLATLDVDAPIFTLIAVDQSRQRNAFLGSGGAASNPERALTQALFELGQARAASNDAEGANSAGRSLRPAEMLSFADGPIYYGLRQNLPKLNWYTASTLSVSWNDLPAVASAGAADEYGAVLSWLAKRRLHPVVFELNGAGWPGLRITKVIVPELTQASIPAYPYLGHPRFYDLPRQLGLARRRLTFNDLNADPVPFS